MRKSKDCGSSFGGLVEVRLEFIRANAGTESLLNNELSIQKSMPMAFVSSWP